MGSVLYFPVDQVESPTIGYPCFRGRFLVRKWKVKTREQSVSRRAVNSTGCSPDAMGMMPGQGMGCADGCARRQRNAKYEVSRAKQSGFAPRGERGSPCMGIWPERCARIRIARSAPTIGTANTFPQAASLPNVAPKPYSAVRVVCWFTRTVTSSCRESDGIVGRVCLLWITGGQCR